MAYLGRNPAIGTQKVLDSLESQFNGSATTFNLRYNSNPIYPTLSSSLIVSLGGVLQEPGTAYVVASDQITFATAPGTGTDCWILLYSEFGAQAGTTPTLTVATNATIGGELRGPANFVIDPAVVGNNTGTVEIKGNLTVQGTTTTINSTTVDLDTLSLGDNEKISLGAGGVGDNGGAVESDLEIYSDGTNAYFDSGFIASTASPNIYFRTSATTTLDTNALTILNTGQVVIGDDAADHASTNFDDLVVGNSSSAKRSGITIVSANNQDGAICFSDGTGASDKQRGQIIYMHDPSSASSEFLDFYVAGSHRLKLDGDGRLVMGTNGGSSQISSAKIQVVGGNGSNDIAIINSAASDDDGARSGNLLFRGSQSGNEKSTLAAVTAFHDGSADDQKGSLILKTNDGSDGDTPTERLRIDSGGNVGVGETSPDVRLHVKETINAAYSLANVVDEANHLLKLENPSTTANAFAGMQFRIGSGADLFFGAIQQSVNHGDFFFANQNSPNAELMRIKSTGNVGIGTDNPQKKLHVLGTSDFVVDTDADALRIGSYGEYDIALATGRNTLANSSRVYIESGDGEHLRITSSGHVIPGGDDTQDLGSTSKRWRNIYTGDLQLSNEGSSNEVDGTWGNYTIQEGEEELFIINRRSGKKFKFVLEEVK